MTVDATTSFGPLAEAKPGIAYVYFILSSTADVLYIGATRDLRRRLRQHARMRPWWAEAAHLRAFPHPSLRAAFEAERTYIGVTNPPYNTQLRGPGPVGIVFGVFFGAMPSEQQMAAAAFVERVRRSVSEPA